MAEELGDDNEIGLAKYQGGREGMPQDVDRRAVVEAGGRADAGDDGLSAADAEPLAALVEEQGGAVGGSRPVGAFGEPAVQRGVQMWVDRDLSDALAFAEDSWDAFAGRRGGVVDVERDDLADPRAGVERDERERLVAGRWEGLDGSEVSELRPVVERAGRGG